MPEQKRKYKLADFVSKIVKDPNSPPNTLLLQGYLGDSSDEGHVRLYLDSQLSDYVEIPEDAILHTQEVPNATLGETYVWINQDAELTHGKAGPQRLKAKFLEGRLQQQFLGGAAAAAPQPAGPIATPPFTVFQQQCHTIGIACIPSLVPIHCPTHAPLLCPVSVPIFHCHSVQLPCNSLSPVACHSVLSPCISQNVACPTQTPALCPVASGALGCGPQGPGPLGPGPLGPGPLGPGPELFAAAAAPPPQTIAAQCPSAIDACPSRLCPSVTPIQCPSQIIVQCPSAVDACPSRLCPSVQPRFCPTGDFVPCPPSVPVFHCPSRIIIQCPSRLVVQCPSVQPRFCPTGDFVPCPPSVPAFHCPPSVPVFHCPTLGIAQCPSAGHPICPSVVAICNTQACELASAACPPSIACQQ